MGTFTDEDKNLKSRVEKICAKRQIKPDWSMEWEIHGPHQDMNYVVYVGGADIPKEKQPLGTASGIIAIYDYGAKSEVFVIDDSDDWYKPENKNRIIS